MRATNEEAAPRAAHGNPRGATDLGHTGHSTRRESPGRATKTAHAKRQFAKEDLAWLQALAALRGPATELEDLVAETLLRAVSSATWSRARTTTELRAWLRRVFEGLRVDHLRQRRAEAIEHDLLLEEAPMRPLGEVGVLERCGKQDAGLILLRDILRCEGDILALFTGLGSSESALRAHRRARQRLRKRFVS